MNPLRLLELVSTMLRGKREDCTLCAARTARCAGSIDSSPSAPRVKVSRAARKRGFVSAN
jgi:hypothetical protein